MLPDVLDLVGVPADEAFGEVLESALDRFGMAFERPFAPAYEPLFCLCAYEEPSRRHAEDLGKPPCSTVSDEKHSESERDTSIFAILSDDVIYGLPQDQRCWWLKRV